MKSVCNLLSEGETNFSTFTETTDGKPKPQVQAGEMLEKLDLTFHVHFFNSSSLCFPSNASTVSRFILNLMIFTNYVNDSQ